MTISRIWAEYACDLAYESLPQNVIDAAKMFILDSFGCALGGSKTEDFAILEKVFREIGGPGTCSVIGSDLRTDVRSASLINGVAIRGLDYNDVYWRQDPSHPSDLLPAAFCVGEAEKKSTRDLIVATVIAYELEMRMCEAAFPGVREVGLHHATLTQFVSPVVAGKMLGLNVDQIVNAIGISGSHNVTLGSVTAGTLTMMKNTVDPMATEAGVFAAVLAKYGYKGPTHVFEGREGLFDAIGKEWEPEVLTENLGNTFRIVNCSIKPFPSEALTHAPISAVLDIVSENNLLADQIESIEIFTLRRAAEILADEKKYIIDSRETADHSLPYCIAAAVVNRELTPQQFTPTALRNEQVLSLVPRVRASLDASYEDRFPNEQPCRVVISTIDGRVFERERAYPKGDPRDQLSTDELKRKFAGMADGILDDDAQAKAFEAVYSMEDGGSISDLLGHFTVSAKNNHLTV